MRVEGGRRRREGERARRGEGSCPGGESRQGREGGGRGQKSGEGRRRGRAEDAAEGTPGCGRLDGGMDVSKWFTEVVAEVVHGSGFRSDF